MEFRLQPVFARTNTGLRLNSMLFGEGLYPIQARAWFLQPIELTYPRIHGGGQRR